MLPVATRSNANLHVRSSLHMKSCLKPQTWRARWTQAESDNYDATNTNICDKDNRLVKKEQILEKTTKLKVAQCQVSLTKETTKLKYCSFFVL